MENKIIKILSEKSYYYIILQNEKNKYIIITLVIPGINKLECEYKYYLRRKYDLN